MHSTKLKVPRGLRSFGRRRSDQHELVDTSDPWDDPIELEKADDVPPETTPQIPDRGLFARLGDCFQYMSSYPRYRREVMKNKSRAQIDGMLDNISTKINEHESKITVLEENMKYSVRKKNKQRARQLLVRKKRTEKALDALYNYRSELENVQMSIEQNDEQIQLVKSFKNARNILKKNVRGNDKMAAVDVYDDLSEDLEECMQEADELQTAVSRSRTNNDAELEDELNELFGDDSPKQTPKIPPAAPPPNAKLRQEADLKALTELPKPPSSAIDFQTDEEAIREIEAPIAA